MKEKLLKAIVLLMASVIVFSSTTLMFSAESNEAPDPTEATAATESTSSTAATEPTAKEPASKDSADSSSSSVKNDESSTPVSEKPSREEGSAIEDEDGSSYDIVTFDDRSFANQKTTKATTKAPAKTTKKAPAKKTTKRAPINALETTVEETSSDIYIDELLAETTAYVWTFAEEETEPEDTAKKSIDFKKVIIIAVIVLAVIGAGVCLIILGKKR